jgi:hypothetical protein
MVTICRVTDCQNLSCYSTRPRGPRGSSFVVVNVYFLKFNTIFW